MLRLFVMSLIAFVIWKLFFRKSKKEQLLAGIFIAAGLFAAAHLAATITLFGVLTPLIVFRCFLLNGFWCMVWPSLSKVWHFLCHACPFLGTYCLRYRLDHIYVEQ
jgi:hypothetical protein